MIYIMEEFDGTKSIFKIGVTVKQGPRVRRRQIQKTRNHPVKLVAGLIGDEGDERFYHEGFSEFSLGREWFRDCHGIRKLIADFPIEKWDKIMNELEWGKLSIEEAYTELTLLRFEPDHIKFKTLELLALKWPLSHAH